MRRPGKSSKAVSAGGLVVLLVLAFAGHAFGNKEPKFAYVANEFGGVSAYTINSTTGALTAVSGSPFAAGPAPDSVAVDPSGKFAYVANEFSGVSAYTINTTTGALTAVTGSPFAAGVNPHSVEVDPSGKFAYVANGNSNSISAYTIDGMTGALAPASGSPFAAGMEPISVAIASQSTFPFAAFTLKADITLGPPSSFELNATFTLGAGSDGINPLTEALTLQVGTFSTTIPAGSFIQDSFGRFHFEGAINSVTLEVRIVPLGGNNFRLTAEGQGANLTGTVNPVTVQLTIGDDGGSTTVTAQFN